MKYKTWCLIGVLTVLSFIIFLKGCDQEHSGDQIVAPEGTQAQKVVLRIAQSPEPRAKALRLKLDAVGLNDQDVAVGPVIAPVTLSDPVFPCEVQLTVFKPPCRYRLTISTDLTREPARSWQDVVNICDLQAGGTTIDVFEEFLVGDLSITAPESVNAGDALDVRCEACHIDAPDRDRYPLTLSLSEQGGRTLSSDAPQETASLSETFADPFALTSPETQRLFTCTLADGRSASQVVQKTVARIPPTPTPTPTPTSTPTPLPTSTPEPPAPDPTPTPIPGATATPIPTPLQIIVDNTDSGVSPNCGIDPYPDCQTIQDGVSAAYAHSGNSVLVRYTGIDYTDRTELDQGYGLILTAESGVIVNYTVDSAIGVLPAVGYALIEISGFEFVGKGIGVAGGMVTIENNTFTYASISQIGGGRVVIRGNEINAGASGAIGATNGEIRIENNQISANTADVIYISGVYSTEIINNDIIAQSGLAVNVNAATNVTFNGNSVTVFAPFAVPAHVRFNDVNGSITLENNNQFTGTSAANSSIECVGTITNNITHDNTNSTTGTISGCTGVGLPDCTTPPCTF